MGSDLCVAIQWESLGESFACVLPNCGASSMLLSKMPAKRGNNRPSGSSQEAPAAKRKRVPEPSSPSDAPVAKRARSETDPAGAASTGGPADTSLKVGMQTRSMSRRVHAAIQGAKDPSPPTTHPAVPSAAKSEGRPLHPETQASCVSTHTRAYDPLLDKPRRRRPQQRNPHRAGLYETYRDRRGTALRGYRLKPANLDPSVPSWRGVVRAGFASGHTAAREAVPAGGSSERGEPSPSVPTAFEQSRPTGTRGARETATAGGKTRGNGSSGDVTITVASASSAAVQHGDSIPGSLSVPDEPLVVSRLKKRKYGANFGEQDAQQQQPAKRRQQQQQGTSTGAQTDATDGTSIQLDAPESTITPQAQVQGEAREAQQTQTQASSSRPVPSGRKAVGRGAQTRTREAGSDMPVQASGVVASDRPAPVEPSRRSQRLLAKSRGCHR
ncbi:hypothetical protein TWF696_004290 [Orbilia brochopaga]|uniref:Nuclear protein MDM1 n=1 Tax=Orbilia brochopaga TaxID=3140254 RepID=A0AAV9V8A0_9PEZI